MENIRFELDCGRDKFWITVWAQLHKGDAYLLIGYLHDDLSVRREIEQFDKGGLKVSEGWYWTGDQCNEKISEFMAASELVWEPMRCWERKSILYRDAGFMNYSEVNEDAQG